MKNRFEIIKEAQAEIEFLTDEQPQCKALQERINAYFKTCKTQEERLDYLRKEMSQSLNNLAWKMGQLEESCNNLLKLLEKNTYGK